MPIFPRLRHHHRLVAQAAHFDDSEHQWVVGSVVNGFDIETVALHEIGHILGLQHSNVAGSVMFPTVSSNSTKRALTADDLGGVRELYPTAIPANGTYTIRQRARIGSSMPMRSPTKIPPGHSPGPEQRHATLGTRPSGSRLSDPPEEQ
jgi:hypothetical protein